jgi:hypothetical protein
MKLVIYKKKDVDDSSVVLVESVQEATERVSMCWSIHS